MEVIASCSSALPSSLSLCFHFSPLSSSPCLVSCKKSFGVSSSRLISRSPHPQLLTRDFHLLLRYTPTSKPLAAVGDATLSPSESTEASFQLEEENASVINSGEEDKMDDGEVDVETLDAQKMVRVCDKLIDVFMVDKPRTTDWRRLLAFSKEWNDIRLHFYRRCQDRACTADDPEMKHKLLRLGRKLKELHIFSPKYFILTFFGQKGSIITFINNGYGLMMICKDMMNTAITEIVSRRRRDFTVEFFEHLHNVAESYYDNPTQRDDLAKLGNSCLAAVQAFDNACESIEALNAAELKFEDIVNSPSLDAACRKIDKLAEKNQLDSALMLILTKAWSAAKESNMMKDEAKDTLYHLYMTARGNLQRLMPNEIRILKYLLTIEDPEERTCALKDAFTPGDEIEGKDIDYAYTTPEKLFTWIRTVVDAYNFSRPDTLIREARDLMNPTIIKRLEELQKLIQDKFM